MRGPKKEKGLSYSYNVSPSSGRAFMRCWPAAFPPCPQLSFLAVARISRCLFGPRLCALRARRAAFIRCPRRGRWSYLSFPSGRAFLRYGPLLLPSCFVLGVAFFCFCVPHLFAVWQVSHAGFFVVKIFTRAVPLYAIGVSRACLCMLDILIFSVDWHVMLRFSFAPCPSSRSLGRGVTCVFFVSPVSFFFVPRVFFLFRTVSNKRPRGGT